MTKQVVQQAKRFLCCALVLLLFSPLFGFSDNGVATMKGQSVTLKQAIQIIEESSDYTFFFKSSDIDNVQKKDVDLSKPVEDVLDDLLKDSGLSYVKKGKEIIITSDQKPTAAPQQAEKKKLKISGTVISAEDKLPVIGASVWLKGTAVGTTTDVDGAYSLTVEGVGGVLSFSYLGLKTQEIPLSNQTTINITLKPDTEMLDEVVVVGYGSQKKESVIGAISTIDVKNLQIPGVSNLSTVLAGQLAGVVGMTRSGEPGRDGAANFYIRGISSFVGAGTPLVLVDGVERSIDLVDTEDIASFSILKDASASAVYGVRGANGVVLITTKKGDQGKPKINARAEMGVTSPTIMPDFLNSAQWAQYYNEASGTKYYTESDIQKYVDGSDPDLYPNINWIDEMYNDMAYNERVNLSVSGGGDIARYYIAGSFYNESSIFKNAGDRYDYNSSINYSKYNFRANIDVNVTPSTVLNVNLANIYEKSFGPGRAKGDIWQYTFLTSPNAYPLEYSDGTLAAPSTNSGYNPWNLLVHSGYREQFWNSSQALVGVTQDIGKICAPLTGLSANAKFSWDAYNTNIQVRSKEPTSYHASGRDEEGNLIFGNPIITGSETLGYSLEGIVGTLTTYMEASLTYNRLFNDKHRVGGLFLYNHTILSKTHSTDKYQSLPYKHQGIAGRVTYAFNDTYFAEFNMGYNGSENFAPGHRFGFFPAGAVGWMLSNESWFAPLKSKIEDFKLKASYGLVGNDEIGGGRRWIYEPTIAGSGSWNYGASGNQGGGGIRIGDLENLNVSWEEAEKFNVGFETSFLKGFRLQADYFHEHRSGIFQLRAGIPAIAGISSTPYDNIGEAQNQGFDGTLEYAKKVGEVFLTARGNMTYNRNKLLNNDEPDWEYKYQNRIGKPFGTGGSAQPFGLVALGLFKSQDEIANSPVQSFGEYRVGDIKYQDINGDGKIDTYDRIAIGYTNLPEIVYGFGLTAQWRSWDFNTFFQGVDHVSFFIGGSTIRPFSTGNMERASINKDLWGKTWMSTNTPEENEGVIYPRMSMSGAAGSSNNAQNSTWNQRDGSFLRMRNVEIGYSLPKSVLKNSFVSTLRFYVSGENLLTFSKFKLWDPEKGNSDGSGYPLLRKGVIGFNANF